MQHTAPDAPLPPIETGWVPPTGEPDAEFFQRMVEMGNEEVAKVEEKRIDYGNLPSRVNHD
jgi:hypothetical protein